MKLITLLIPIFFLYTYSTKAQGSLLGGVTNPMVWGIAETKNNLPVFTVHSENEVANLNLDNLDLTLFNYNPALLFEQGTAGIQIPIDNRDLSKLTVFAVYHTADSLWEKGVWYLRNQLSPKLLLTTHRMTDWQEVKFMNFLDSQKDLPVISTYKQFKSQDSTIVDSQKLIIGANPNTPDIPIVSFTGLFAEIIVYDRVLSPEEQQQVESYLSLKYGIPLSQNSVSNYINSKKEVIWDSKESYPYNYRTTGIGRDDSSVLYQKQSKNSYDPELLSISAGQTYYSNKDNPAVFNDNSFLIWSDNNLHFSLAEQEQGKPQRAKRKWLMTAFGETQNIETELRFDVRRMALELSDDETWWLAVDRSGTGEFPLNEVEYFPTQHITDAGIAVFENILWDNDLSGVDLFTIGVGPILMPKYWIEQPLCFPETDGKIYVGVEGGKPPYSFVFRDLNNFFRKTWVSQSNDLEEISNVQPGDYILSISDASGRTSSESIYIQSKDAPVSELNAHYRLMPDSELVLDATSKSEYDNISFLWSGPDNFFSTSPEVSISMSGTYIVILNYQGCESKKEIKVSKYSEDNFKKVEVFPNPAAEGNFNLAIYLRRPAKTNVRVRNSIGTMVFSTSLNGEDYYKKDIHIDCPSGIYFVTVTSENTSKTLKLVVE